MRLIAFLIAVAGPFLLNEVVLPNTSHPNQIFAVFGWGLVLWAAPAGATAAGSLRDLRPLQLALALVCVGAAWSMAIGGVPESPGVAMLAMQLMAAGLALHGASVGGSRPEAVFRPFAIALVVGGVLGAVAGAVQIFAPVGVDNHFIAALVSPGRAVGNLGQPNQFADTQVWALAASVTLLPAADARDARARAVRLALYAAMALLVLGVVLSASRVGMIGIAMLAAWGIFDKSLPRQVRVALAATPVAAALFWIGVDLWSHGNAAVADLGARPGSDISSSRFRLWKHALTLIAQQPWLGVGWGQYGFAYALTPMADRQPRFDDHAHNLVLQLAAELGIPLALVILVLLGVALWLAIRNVRRLAGAASLAGRSALAMILFMGVHSMLEYPLWYTYFLFPTAWLWGLALGCKPASAPAPVAEEAPRRPGAMAPERAWRVAGLLMTAAGVVTWMSYMSVADAYRPNYVEVPLAVRLGRAEASPLFRNYADRMIALQAMSPADVLPEIQRAFRANPNGGVMFAWMNALEMHGDDDQARFVAARLREFGLKGPAPFFAPCDDPANATKPFQCLPPPSTMTWHDLR